MAKKIQANQSRNHKLTDCRIIGWYKNFIKGGSMEICGMPLVESLNLLLNNNFNEGEKGKRLKIKKEISEKIAGRNNGNAALVADEVLNMLKPLRQNMTDYPEIGLADLLSLVNSKSEGLKKSFPPDVQERIRWMVSWREWRNFPPTSSVHIFRQ